MNVVTLKSGQVLKHPTPIKNDVELESESGEQLEGDVDKRKKGSMKVEKKEKGETSRIEKLDKQFGRFLDVLKKVHVNLPFIEVLSQMPAYTEFLKEILTNKRKIKETSVVTLTEHCSVILQNNLPQKCGDPGSFTIPCSLGTINFDESLCDSGASINLMPLSIYRKLDKEIGEIRSVPISLQLVDQMTLILEGIVEEMLVWLDKFVFPVDFIVVKMGKNKEVPLILGGPFLAMGRSILDIHKRKLMLRVGEETVTFEMNVVKGAQKEKPAASVGWKVKGSKEKAALSEKDKYGVYPKKAEKKLSAWRFLCLIQIENLVPYTVWFYSLLLTMGTDREPEQVLSKRLTLRSRKDTHHGCSTKVRGRIINLRFNGQYYGWWKTRMHDFFMAEDSELWDVICDGPFVPMKAVGEGTKTVPKTRKEYNGAD
ncbi:uncharacterized protein [Nicotiana tomentosiformis]|uniref:uncharacterized protein n=1 Tax=Nicotiana tomentosiformis TaxID=4098 RepID=UPI00388CE3E2